MQSADHLHHLKSPSQPNCPQSNPQANSEKLYLRINWAFVRQFPKPTSEEPFPTPLPPSPNVEGNLYVLTPDLLEISPFAGNNVDWLIKIARLIFEPLGTSSLFTFNTGSVDEWLGKEAVMTEWREVQHGEPLRATIYEFRPDNGSHITLAKINLCQRKQWGWRQGTSNEYLEFKAVLEKRDRACVVTSVTIPTLVAASHLIPKKLGVVSVEHIISNFAQPETAPTQLPVDIYDPIIGFLLMVTLNYMTARYKLGYWNVGPNHYVIHDFDDLPITVFGAQIPPSRDPPIHGRTITLTTHDPAIPLPHPAVFDWHYLQCVIGKFGTSAYKKVENVNYLEFPFHTDSSSESD